MRQESAGSPEIWLVFKVPGHGMLNDPGSELTKVLEFRKKQEALRQVLFKEVANSEEWRADLYDWLLEHVLEIARSASDAADRPPTEPLAGINTAAPLALKDAVVGEQYVPVIPKQLAALSEAVSRVILSGNLEFEPANQRLLAEFEVARLYLLSATWMAGRYTFDFLGTHEMNLLYKSRRLLDVTVAEQRQLLRTVLHASSNVVPGWFWLRDSFSAGTSDTLLFIASHDPDATLRARALEQLTSAQIHIPENSWAFLPLSDDSDEVAVEAFKYLGSTGSERALDLIEKHLSEDQGPLAHAAAMDAKLLITIRTDSARAFSELISSGQYLSAELLHLFSEVIATVGTEDLVKAVETRGDEVKELSAVELARRGDFPLDLALSLRDDPSIDVKQIALQVIVNNKGSRELDKLREAAPRDALALLSGRKDLDINLIAFNYFRTFERGALLDLVGWLNVDGPVAYKVLALDHFDSVSDMVRSDLADGFKRIKETYIERLKSELGADPAEEFAQRVQERKLDEFIRSNFTEAALSGLLRHGQTSDLEIARKYLRSEDRDLQLVAAKIVSRFGDEQDVQTLLDVSNGAWGELEEFGPKTAITLSHDPQSLAIAMAQSDNAARSKAALGWLVGQDSARIRDFFRSLLSDENGSRRVQAVQYLSRRFDEKELEKLLDEYLTWEGRNGCEQARAHTPRKGRHHELRSSFFMATT